MPDTEPPTERPPMKIGMFFRQSEPNTARVFMGGYTIDLNITSAGLLHLRTYPITPEPVPDDQEDAAQHVMIDRDGEFLKV